LAGNGSGKSTLLKLLNDELQPDAGSVWRQPGVRSARLEQDVPLSSNRTVFDVVAEGHPADPEADEAWWHEHLVGQVLSRLGLNPSAVVDTLSGGRLTPFPGDYATYGRRKEEQLAAEEAQAEKFDRKLAVEEAWLRQGIKARRTRNEGRVRALLAMRAERARREQTGSVRLKIEQADITGQMVLEADGVTKSFAAPDPGQPDKPAVPAAVIRNFSTRIMRGDRIGVPGPNGAGKTTLLRLLIGELPPDAGDVRRGANVQIA
jgi:ATPase subunit of ABC transporter with duplicated ATPase domains